MNICISVSSNMCTTAKWWRPALIPAHADRHIVYIRAFSVFWPHRETCFTFSVQLMHLRG